MMCPLRFLPALALAAVLQPCLADAQATPAQPSSPTSLAAQITMTQAVARALTSNPTLLATRQHLEAVRSQRITAGLRANPTLTILGQGVTLPEVNNDGGNPYFYSGNVTRLFERGQKRRWRLDAASATDAQTEQQLLDQERQITLQVRQAFINLLTAKASLDIAEENLKDYQRTIELTQARLDAGVVTRTDFERIDLQLAQFESDDDTARLAMLQSAAQLQLFFGVGHPDPSFDVSGSLDVPLFATTRDEAERLALAHRPDLAAVRQGLAAAEANARYAVAQGTADPTLAAEYERSGADNTFGASVSIPLRLFDRNQGEKARTTFEVASSRLTIQATRNQAVNDVDQAWNALEIARRQAERYNSRYLAEAVRVRDNLQFSYRNGNSTLLDYLGALHDYRAIHLASLNANAQVLLAIQQLSFATATDILP